MNVSITEDATMSLTRSEGGATVVLLDAIVIVPAQRQLSWVAEAENFTRPAVSLFPNQG
jgi:hypothetical protein